MYRLNVRAWSAGARSRTHAVRFTLSLNGIEPNDVMQQTLICAMICALSLTLCREAGSPIL